MNSRKAPLLLAFVLLVSASALLVSRTQAAEGSSSPKTGPGTQSAAARNLGTTPASRAGTPRQGTDELERPGEDLVSFLRSRYGTRIRDPHTQMRMLEQLMRHFQKLNPSGWEADLLALLKQAFPELYDELALRLRQRQDYERWMKEHKAQMRDLPPAERRDAVWEERNQLFGKDVAEKIWAAELRNMAVADALTAIDTLPNATLDERMARYKQSLNETYGEHSQAYVATHRDELMNRFLDLGSVQKDLGAMTPEQRAEHLRSLRKEMGLDEEALARWKELDQRRDVRWELGSHYMSEREALAQQYSGPELEAKLTELRARYFPDEASTLAEEEASGFFRFALPRKWGRN